MNLYAWSRNGYIVVDDADVQTVITLYTLSATPMIGDLIYKVDGTPARQGELKYYDGNNEEVNLDNTISNLETNAIVVHGISDSGSTELAPDFSRDAQNDREVDTEKPVSKISVKGTVYTIKDAQARTILQNLIPTVITDADNTNLQVAANTIYKFTNALTSLTLTSVEISDYESVLYFTTGNTINFVDNSNLKWGGDGTAPSLEANTIYCIAICNGLAEIDSFGTSV